MALYTVSGGGQINAADLNQLVNLLNGTTTGVPVTLASTLSVGGSPAFIIDTGSFVHMYGGGQDNLNNIAGHLNFNSRSGVIGIIHLFGGNHGSTDYLITSVNTTTNPVQFNFQMNSGNTGTNYEFAWMLIG